MGGLILCTNIYKLMKMKRNEMRLKIEKITFLSRSDLQVFLFYFNGFTLSVEVFWSLYGLEY